MKLNNIWLIESRSTVDKYATWEPNETWRKDMDKVSCESLVALLNDRTRPLQVIYKDTEYRAKEYKLVRVE